MQVILVSLFLYSAQQHNNNPVIGNLTHVSDEEDNNGTKVDNSPNMNTEEDGNGTRSDNSPNLNTEEHGNGTRSDNSHNVNDEEHDKRKRRTRQTNLEDEDRFVDFSPNGMSKLDRWRNDLTYKVIIVPFRMNSNVEYMNPIMEFQIKVLMEVYNDFGEFLSDSALKIEKFVHRRYCRKRPTPYKHELIRIAKQEMKSMAEEFKNKHNGLTLDEVWYKTINSTSEKIVIDLEAIDDILGYLMEEAQLIRRATRHKIIRYYYEFMYRYGIFREKQYRLMMIGKSIFREKQRQLMAADAGSSTFRLFGSSNNTATYKVRPSVRSKYKYLNRLDSKWRRYRAIIVHVGSLCDKEAAPPLSIASLSDNDPSDSTQKLISFWSNCNTELDSYPSFAKLVDTRPENHNWLSNIREHANNNPAVAFSSISIAVIGLIALISIIFKRFTRRKRNYTSAVELNDF